MTEPLPDWVARLVDALVASGCWAGPAPNHVLINDFVAGAGLTPHTDGPLYSSRVATLSLGSDVLLDLHKPGGGGGEAGASLPPPPSFIESPHATKAEYEKWLEQREAAASSGGRPFAQLLLRRRSLNVMSDDAYTHVFHGITAHERDVVGPLVANRQSEAELGEVLQRAHRVSVVFVHKLAA